MYCRLIKTKFAPKLKIINNMYRKKVNEHLDLSLSYTVSEDVDCRITFHNTLNETVAVNRPNSPADVNILLGYIQLIGYVCLNYRFDLSQSNSISQDETWWKDSTYYDYYHPEDEDELDIKEDKLEKTVFLTQNLLAKRLVIGGRLGGVNDLTMGKDDLLDESAKYLLHDLLFAFNSLSYTESENDDERLPTKDVTDSIVPFFTTSQVLLFTSLVLKPKSSKTFLVKFAKLDPSMPPTYNANSTGLAANQGWTSIKYLLVVGMQEKSTRMKSRAVYFPFVNEGKRVGYNERWLQPDYLSQVKFDKTWKVQLGANEKAGNKKHTKEKFLSELDQLIDSDVHKVAVNERRKSSIRMDTSIPEGLRLIPQIAENLRNQYHIRVNTYDLCVISLSRPYYHVGDDINFCVDINPEVIAATRVVGIIGYLEAQEVYHLQGKVRSSEYVNTYKVSPNVKVNTFAASMLNTKLQKSGQTLVSRIINIPRHLCHQFQSSKFMDLRYFVVFKFNMNDFNRHGNLPPDTSVEQQYKFDNYLGSEFQFKIPISILPAN